jgi:hypothetical protein
MTTGQRVRLVQRLATIGKAKFRFSPDLVTTFLERNRADIEWMEQRLGQSLDEDWREHRQGDVRNEDDLLRSDPEVVEKLRGMLGEAAPAGVKGETPEEVALLVHALRDKNGPRPKRRIGRGDGAGPARRFWLRALSRGANAQPNGVDVIGQMQQTHPH